MKISVPLLWLAAFCLFNSSCSPAEEDLPLPENVLESEAGLKFKLMWDTGSTPEKAIEEADLDLFLLIGHDTAGKAAWYGFEEMELKAYFTDGAYIVQIDAFKISKTTHYTLQVSNAGETAQQTFSGSFEAGDEQAINFLEVRKTGTSYTLKSLLPTQE